jgi:hypothetical protein
MGIVLLIFVVLSFTPFLSSPSSDDEILIPDNGIIRFMNFNLHFGVELDKGYALDGFREVILENKPNIVGFEEITNNSPVNGFVPMYSDLKVMMKDIGFPFSYTQEGGRNYLRRYFLSMKLLKKTR